MLTTIAVVNSGMDVEVDGDRDNYSAEPDPCRVKSQLGRIYRGSV